AGTKLALLKRAMGFVIQNLGPADRLAVIAFSSTARRLFPLRKMSDAGKQQALQAVNSLVANGGTNIAEAGTSVYVFTKTLFRKQLSEEVWLESLRFNGSSSLKTFGSGFGNIEVAAWRGLFGRGGIGRSKVITGSFDQFTGFIRVLPKGGPESVGPCNGTSFHLALQTGQI
nr:hypothetical protein [Tanacetum cinerariifolium]